jgi:vitamin B12 transporter
MNSIRSALNPTRPASGYKRRHLPAAVTLLSGIILMSALGWAQQAAVRRVQGTVLDLSGAPVPRVAIEIRSQAGAVLVSTLTDIQGKFSADLPDGQYTLDATAAGLAPIRRQSLDVGPTMTPVHLTLEIPAIEQSIVVTATRTEAPLSQVGSSTTVIRGDELAQAGIDTMADALRKVAGLAITQNGADGQLTSLFIRGGESDYAKVLIDGIPINDPGGSFNFSNLSVSSIDRIEIVRGPQSALFGSDAMAGVVQVFTRRGNSEGLNPLPHFSVEGGSFATFRYEAALGGKNDRFDYSADFSRIDTDNHVRNGSFNDATASLNLGFRPSAGTQIRAVFRSSGGRAGVPGQWAFHAPDSDQYYRHRGLAGGLSFTQSINSTWTHYFSYGISDSRQFSEDSVDAGSYIPEYQGQKAPFAAYDSSYQTLNRSRRQTFAYRSEVSLPHAHLVTAGVEFERESGVVGDPRSDPLKAVRNNFGAFVQDQWFFQKRFFAAAGVRLEHNESFGLSAAPRLSLAWQVYQPGTSGFLGLTRIKTNVGLGIKEPTLVESFSKSPFFLGNPNLKPEKSRSFDFGIEQQFCEGKGVFEATWFDNRFRNQIGFVTTNYTTFSGTFFNIGKTRARGMEISGRQDLLWHFRISGSYTFVDSLVLETGSAPDPVFAPGQALFRRPRHSGSLELRWQPGRWTFGATATMVGNRLDSDFLGLDLTTNPAYSVLDLAVSFRLFGQATIFATVNNVSDRNYMEVLGYPALPARFRIGLSTGF